MPEDRRRLSAEARRSLEERLQHLQDDRLPLLERGFAETRDPQVEAALVNTRAEAERLKEALATATPLEDEPHDPTIVELGDAVTIRAEGSSTRERFTVVGELEARMNDTWISERAPLGAALLGTSVGDVVSVETPEGATRYQVLAIQRDG